MARTAERVLKLLSLLQNADRWGGPELAARLGVSLRTVRRDVETLRQLGFPVQASGGRHSTYHLGSGSTLPPLVLDDEQATAISVALQSAPMVVLGLRDAAQRALATLAQVMPAPLRAHLDATRVTTLRNYWEFPAPPIALDILNAVGNAVRKGHLLQFDVLRPDRSRPDPGMRTSLPRCGSNRTTSCCGQVAGIWSPSIRPSRPGSFTASIGSMPTWRPGFLLSGANSPPTASPTS